MEETLDNLLETIAYESYATNTYLAELINGESNERRTRLISNNNNNSHNDHINNNNINPKTDTLSRYLDNVINFNFDCGNNNNNNLRKSDSEGSSSDQNMTNGKLPPSSPQVTNKLIHLHHRRHDH